MIEWKLIAGMPDERKQQLRLLVLKIVERDSFGLSESSAVAFE